MSPYKRILVKLSGEALLGNADYGIDPGMLKRVAGELAEVSATGVEVAVVIGGGNIFRGAGLRHRHGSRHADQMGMLATVINSLPCRTLSRRLAPCARDVCHPHQRLAEDFVRRRAIRHLEKGRSLIFAAGLASRTSPPIPRRACVRWRSAPMSC